jgi:hypothetical protein
MREQALSAMIQESYVKEIGRVKRQQIMESAEECKADIIELFPNQCPNTASSGRR